MAKTPAPKTPAAKPPATKTPAAAPATPEMVQLTISVDEAEMLIDALEADHEGYVEAVKEARGNNNRDDVATFSEAATRIQGLMTKIQALIGED